jgi:transposase
MYKNKKHEASFKLKVIKEHLRGDSLTGISKRWEISRSLLTRWIDHYNSSGSIGLLSKSSRPPYSVEFKQRVVDSYKNENLSLRDCCLRYKIPAESTVLLWVKKYDEMGMNGLIVHSKRTIRMNKDKGKPKEQRPLTRLEELEKENLRLRAEIELLKKLEALVQEKEAQKKKR